MEEPGGADRGVAEPETAERSTPATLQGLRSGGQRLILPHFVFIIIHPRKLFTQFLLIAFLRPIKF